MRLSGTVAAHLGTGLERIFERRIPIAAAVAAAEQQPERQHRKDESRDPHRRSPRMYVIIPLFARRREAAMVRAQWVA